MKNRTILTVISGLFLFAICMACGSSGSSTSGSTETEEADDGLTEVPNSTGLRARVPEGVTPNGFGGAAGFHTDDDSFSMRLRQDDSGMSIADVRETVQLIGFDRFIQNEETPDGYVITWAAHRVDDQGNPTETEVFSVSIKRNIGETSYLCEGGANSEANLAHVVEACQSVVSGS